MLVMFIVITLFLALLFTLNGTGAIKRFNAKYKNKNNSELTNIEKIFDLTDWLYAETPSPRLVFNVRSIIIYTAILIPFLIDGFMVNNLPSVIYWIWVVLGIVLLIVFIYLNIVNAIKRCKDIGVSPWFLLFPVVNIAISFMLVFSQSQHSSTADGVYRPSKGKKTQDSAHNSLGIADRKKQLEAELEELKKVDEYEKDVEGLEKEISLRKKNIIEKKAKQNVNETIIEYFIEEIEGYISDLQNEVDLKGNLTQSSFIEQERQKVRNKKYEKEIIEMQRLLRDAKYPTITKNQYREMANKFYSYKRLDTKVNSSKNWGQN